MRDQSSATRRYRPSVASFVSTGTIQMRLTRHFNICITQPRSRAGQEQHLNAETCLRIANGDFRLFPDTAHLEPSRTATRQLNPEAAIKLRNITIRATLSKIPPDCTTLFIDAENGIQILPNTMSPCFADKGQCAAFIYDERIVVVWADQVEHIPKVVQDLNMRLLVLAWRDCAEPLEDVPSSKSDRGHGHRAYEQSQVTGHNIQLRFASAYPQDIDFNAPKVSATTSIG